MRRPRLLHVLLPVLVLSAYALGGDWTQFRYDAHRGAASPEELPATLHLQWKRQLPEPLPAFRRR